MTHGPHGTHSAHPDLPVEELFTAEFWDARYAERDAIWSGRPNGHLVAVASGLRPGDALDLGCGEGADVVWLARRGWTVTGVDISTVALGRAAEAAAASGVADRVTLRQVDMLTHQPEPASFDLVSSQFIHLPRELRSTLNARLAAAVRRGGSLLVVGHHVSDLETTIGRPNLPELFFDAEEVAAALDPDAWDVVTAAAPERETLDPNGDPVTIRDAVLHAVRR
jgi:SAM-dependent methyltransferase